MFAFIAGRAEPAPPRRGPREVTGLAGKGPKMTRKVGLAEGCALRVRKWGPPAYPKVS